MRDRAWITRPYSYHCRPLSKGFQWAFLALFFLTMLWIFGLSIFGILSKRKKNSNLETKKEVDFTYIIKTIEDLNQSIKDLNQSLEKKMNNDAGKASSPCEAPYKSAQTGDG